MSAKAAKRLLVTIKPRDKVGRLRRRLAAEKLGELVALDTKIAAGDAEIADLVRRTETTLPELLESGRR